MCAGLTTFNALRNSGARPGDVVAIHGLGGLGHLGVQYAAKMGFHTVGIARGRTRRRWPANSARRSTSTVRRRTRRATAKLGGAGDPGDGRCRSDERPPRRPGRQRDATGVGAVHRCRYPLSLLKGCRSVKGWYSGTAIDSQDTLAFSVRAGVRSMNETFPLDRVFEAYDRMMSGKARFRVVLTIAE